MVKMRKQKLAKNTRKKTLDNQFIIKFPGFNPLCANPTKWSNTLKQFVGKFPTNCLSVFDHFVILVFKGLRCRAKNNV